MNSPSSTLLAKSLSSSMRPASPIPPVATLTPMRSCIGSNASSFHRGISGCASEGIGPRRRSPSDLASASKWRKNGWIHAVYYNDQKEYLYEPYFEGLPRYSQNQAQTVSASSIDQSFKEE